MANTNDKEILKLKDIIKIKKDKLGKLTRFNPKTNCILELNGEKINIHVATKSKLLLLIAQLRVLSDALKKEYPEETLIIGTYNVQDWIDDLKSKFEYANEQDERARLDALEKKLTSLLTEETSTSLVIDDIKNLLS